MNSDREVAEKIVSTYHFPDGVRKMRGKLTRRDELKAITQDVEAAITTAKQELAQKFVKAVRGCDPQYLRNKEVVEAILKAVAKAEGIEVD